MNDLAYLKELAAQYNRNLISFDGNTTFEDMHMDSYAKVDFMMKVEQHYDITFDDDVMLAAHSMKDVLDMIKKYKQEEN